MMEQNPAEKFEAGVIGGGLGGLAAACLLASSGCRVGVFEKSRTLGGRAGTQEKNGALLNLGPHALYKAGRGYHILRQLKIPISGGTVDPRGFLVTQGHLHQLPTGPLSMLKTNLFPTAADRWATLQIFFALPHLDPERWRGLGVTEWLRERISRAFVRELIGTLIRLSTYCSNLEHLEAASAIRQLQRALKGVLYLDGGWQSLVRDLERAARQLGVPIFREACITAIEGEGKIEALRLGDGRRIRVGGLISTISPRSLTRLMGEKLPSSIRIKLDSCRPVEVAGLDLVLKDLPIPGRSFVLGMDQPIYFSVHSAFARLSHRGHRVVHLARYLDRSGPPPATRRHQLEQFAELVQPGWRDHLIHSRFIPRLTVAHDFPRSRGGDRLRPESLHQAGFRGVYFSGDWVESDSLLLDAALDSASRAVNALLSERREVKAS